MFVKKKKIYSAGGTIPVLDIIVLITVPSTIPHEFVGYMYCMYPGCSYFDRTPADRADLRRFSEARALHVPTRPTIPF